MGNNLSPITGLVERLTRPIIGIENRTALEAFDIMADRIRSALCKVGKPAGGDDWARDIRSTAQADCGCRIPPPFDEVADHAICLAYDAALSLPTPTVDREAIARVLHDRFRERARQRVTHDPRDLACYSNNEWEDLPASFKREYRQDADAILALLHSIDDISETGEAG